MKESKDLFIPSFRNAYFTEAAAESVTLINLCVNLVQEIELGVDIALWK